MASTASRRGRRTSTTASRSPLQLATRALDTLASLVGPVPRTFEPRKQFGLDGGRLVAYLTAALAQGAAAQDVWPAWIDFFRNAPRKMATGAHDWVHVLQAARMYYVHFEGRPVEDVAEELTDLAHDRDRAWRGPT